MKLLKKITILLCFLSLIAFVSCSAEDKSGVKEKDNADGTEITGGGKSGNSGTGGGSETGGSTGTGGGTETTETGNFPPPAGTYKDKDGKNRDTKVTIEGEKTKMEGGTTNSEGDSSGFGFNITEWKKTIKDGKDIKLESVDATDAWGWAHSNISIVYYYDTQTLHITYDTALHGKGHSFIGTKQP
ncbi:hypothetical protein EPJ74_03905 [Brachyspira aalborgi]|uniref:Lipoprotein n=1 Tax=Brachyspira aalborgi TaxID=29522 RepID=A0A5C8GHF6_9SPIR|nr:hypothetical protein [Brachyspira aalborgi]TXJ61381.1 hypothetical protein EPJ74_03905 [Brachyspira aalborgi]